MPCFDEYHVGWICQIDIEYIVAKTFLDENHDEPDLPPNDTNAYTLGKIGKHNVVIAVSGKRDWGLSTVAISATHMLRSFPNIKSFLLVTIAGGAPTPYDDIRLGDIVVSASRRGDVVFQFDYGRCVQDRGFIPKRSPTNTPTSLQAAVNRLKDRYRIEGNRLEQSITSMIDKNPILREYRRPDLRSDRLYQSHFVHSAELPCTVICDDPSSLVMRPERTEHKDKPVIHYGRIASGNQLINDASVRNELSIKENVLCFETGAAGLMNDFPSLVICGISDYADTHRPKEWQPYAAMVAAAYAKDLIDLIPTETGKKRKDTLSPQTMTMKELEQTQAYEDYTVGVICAIEFEMSAVRYMLDKEHKRLERQKGESTTYFLGELSGHNVVLACLPGTQGKGAAALVAKDMARTFPSIELRLMVGIGGGVPSQKNDIRLGDVVVSMPDGQHGGVAQYDLGKSTENGFILKGFLSPPPDILRSAVGLMRGDHRLSQNRIPEFLSAMFEKGSRLQNSYKAPASELDQLFELDGKTKVNNRPAREPGPEIHYGLVASGDQVIRSAINATEIGNRVGGGDILCFEMEAAGIMTEFPCIVIRGISDYADSHKNDAWQHYAAATAAACAKELLSYC